MIPLRPVPFRFDTERGIMTVAFKEKRVRVTLGEHEREFDFKARGRRLSEETAARIAREELRRMGVSSK